MAALKQEPQAVTFNDHLSSNALLTKIDTLRELNLGAHEIGLPQLVVVGDQSSGKSSLLESLTGIPFPRGQNLCTRYATQITSRRDNISSISVDIIPDPRATDEHKLRLSEFKPLPMDPEDFKAKFPVVLELVNKAMDIATDPSLASGTIFSRDVLRVTITGPQADYLTIIDVPGIFRNTTSPITEEDITLVRDMVTGYITNSRTVILAVIPANVDIATQEILSLAKKQDPLGKRTLAILTKADTVLEPSAQKNVCDLVAGRRPGLELGYHLVRNRGADDNDPIESGKLDKYFQSSPWNKLPPESVGIHQLRLRLGKLLGKLTAGEFPKVKKDVMAMLRKAHKDLEALGAPRTTDIEKRHMLQTIAAEFVGITIDATRADYNRWVGFTERTKLITRLMDVKQKFKEVLLKNGHTWEFEDDVDLNEDYEKKQYQNKNFKASVASGTNRFVTKSYSINSLIKKLETSLPWVADKLDGIESITPPSPNILSAIRDINSRSYGRNITGISSGVLPAVFICQSQKWSAIAHIFVAHSIYHVHEFITLVCRSITEHDQILGERILDALEEELRMRYQKAFKHVEFLEQIEKRCELQTLNDEFHKRRETHAINEYINTISSEINSRKDISTNELKSIIAKGPEPSPEKEIYHRLEPYYRITVREFMDNVWKQAVEWFLVTSKDSPLGLFTQEWVSALDSETLATIAAEDDEVKIQRELLTRKIEDLEKAAKILRF